MKKISLFVVALISMFMFTFVVNAKEVTDVATLKDCLSNGGECKLANPIDAMDDDYTTDDERIVINKDVNLDLNGMTLKAIFGVEGGKTFTIDSSVKGGKLIANSRTTASAAGIWVETSKFILNGGAIVNDNGYGIYALDGATVIINDGSIESRYSAVAGNNTTGVTYFEVYGGELTSKEYAAIYQPSPVSLKMTGGILNGGIELRMGIVDISGGTINAKDSSFKDPKDCYTDSKPIALPDALVVLGGTYTAKGNYSNKLELNITGGTFNVKNGKGSAVAIYDYGKVEQEITVNISGSAKLVTDSLKRGAYNVLSLSDIGVTTPATGYGVYSGKVVTNITGGTFSSDVFDYTSDNYITVSTKDGYVVKPNVEVGTSGSSNTNGTIESETPFDKTLYLEINKYSDDNAKEAKDQAIGKYKNNKKIKDLKFIGLYEINMVDGVEVWPMENGKFTISIAIDRSLRNYDSYKVLYFNHDHILEEEFDAKLEDGMIKFTTTHLSDYAIIGYNSSNSGNSSNVKNPNTGDNIIKYVALGMLSLAGVGVVVLKKQKQY